MNQASNHWGVELTGANEDKKCWRMLLKPPFDPFVEEVKNKQVDYLALRSTTFDGVAKSEEVHELAKLLFRTLNVAMSKHAATDPVMNGAVVEFTPNGQIRKHYRLEVEGAKIRIRGGRVNLTVTDAQGNVIEPPPAPSRAQLWMRAATLNPEIGSVLRYLEGKPNWIELYKAHEALLQMPKCGISNNRIKRFTRTANVGERHHPNNKRKPHKRPMDLWEARALITQWVSAAIDDVLAKNP